MTDLVAYTTDEVLQVHVTGAIPNSCFAHRFGDGQHVEAFFDPTEFGEVKLKCTNGGAAGAGAVVLQQLRR